MNGCRALKAWQVRRGGAIAEWLAHRVELGMPGKTCSAGAPPMPRSAEVPRFE
jgi:hypothetical protein